MTDDSPALADALNAWREVLMRRAAYRWRWSEHRRSRFVNDLRFRHLAELHAHWADVSSRTISAGA